MVTETPVLPTPPDRPLAGLRVALTARSPIRIATEYGDVERAPLLGEHTDEVLTEVLGLDGGQLAGLHDRGVLA